jgi:hypothetical protein
VALSCQVVDLTRLYLADHSRHAMGSGQISLVQAQGGAIDVRNANHVAKAFGVERAGPTDGAVRLIVLGQQKLRQIGTTLPGHARNQRLSFGHIRSISETAIGARIDANDARSTDSLKPYSVTFGIRSTRYITAPVRQQVPFRHAFAPPYPKTQRQSRFPASA